MVPLVYFKITKSQTSNNKNSIKAYKISIKNSQKVKNSY